MSEGYTPTTDEVREAVAEWMWSRRMFRPELRISDGREFDRWAVARAVDHVGHRIEEKWSMTSAHIDRWCHTCDRKIEGYERAEAADVPLQ